MRTNDIILLQKKNLKQSVNLNIIKIFYECKIAFKIERENNKGI